MIEDRYGLEGLDAKAKRERLALLLRHKAIESGEPFPLSLGQEALWFLHELAPDSAAYNVAFCARVHSEVDRGRLELALLKLMERHSVLRCTIVRSAQGPRQRIGPVPERCLEIVDASGLDEEELKARVEETYARPFDLTAGPVFRCTLFSRCPTEHVLLLSVHHVFSDAWSVGILVGDLMTLYENGPTALAPLPATAYADYVNWQRSALDSAEGCQAWEYWQARLKDLPSTRLPADYPRPKIQSFQGGSHHFELSAELWSAIRALARAQDATPFMVVAAALHALLARYCGSPLVPIGTPLSRRPRREDEGTVGYFVNPAVLCAPVQPETTFRQHIADMRAAAIGVQRFGDFPFPELVKRLQPVRDTSEMPIFQVMLNLIKATQVSVYKDMADADAQVRVGSLVLQAFPLNQQEAQFDLDLDLFDTGGAIPATFKYRTDLFQPATIERLAGHFVTLLFAAVAEPDRRISDLPLLTEPERQRVVLDWNATAKPYPATPIHRLIEEQVRRTSEATALVFEGKTMSYGELNRRANQLAHRLRQLGVAPDTLVAVCLERSFEMVVALLGILKVGGAYVPIDPYYPPERQAYMIRDCQAPVILTQAKLAGQLGGFGASLLMLDTGWEEIGRQSGDDLDSDARPDHLAYVIYTSGSTGKPKGVQVSRGALLNLLLSMREWLQLSDADRLLAVATISFDIAGVDIWLPLMVGAQTIIASLEVAADGRALRGLIEANDISFLQATPATWRLLFEGGWRGKPDLQAVCTGEAMPPDVAAQLVPVVQRAWNLYGPTETTIWSTGCELRNARAPILIGRPIANTQCYILDSHLQPVPIGVTGELYIGGDGLARGYLNRPELTAERFVPNPFRSAGERMYRTGDLARYRQDGHIECLGRIDHQVKIRGYRIELGEIETAISEHAAVAQAVVVAREDIPGDTRLVAYVVARPQRFLDIAQLHANLRKCLPDYMVPSALIVLPALPLNPSGKVDRKALPAPERGGDGATVYEAPRTPTEQTLARIFAEVLKLERAGIRDDFFDLGGHSLLATGIVSRLQTALGVELPVRQLFQCRTVAGLAEVVEAQLAQPRQATAPASIPRVSREDRRVRAEHVAVTDARPDLADRR